MARKLIRGFYVRDTLTVAQELLGKFIVRRIGGKLRTGMIVETEAYVGPQDRASHAYNGKITSRNKAEYMIGGHIYIYLVYGINWQLNISMGLAGAPECVLIRALQPMINNWRPSFRARQKNSLPKGRIPLKNLANGPGKLCRWLRVNKSFYGEDLTKSKRIWLEDRGVKIKKREIVSSPRIGIDYAGPVWAKKPWRFYIKNNPFVSRI